VLKVILLSVVGCALSLAIQSAEDPPADSLKVEARGLRIIADSIDAEVDEGMRPFGQLPGTTIAVHVQYPKGGLIKFDMQNSTISKFIDEKGNDLLAPRGGDVRPIGNTAFSMSPALSRDGKTCTMEISAPNIPVKSSSYIKVEGMLSMLTASEKSELSQKDVAMRNGSSITLGKHDLSIDKVGKPLLGDEPLGFTLQSQSEMNDVAEIRFYKADGSEIKSRRVSTSKTQIQGMLKIEWDYALAEKVEIATVKLVLWSNLKAVRAPFSLLLSTGL
jgi:hypothetical protein